MTMFEELITVIVPCYNHEKYIIECLESINNQTYRDFQWIVIDDGSKDSSPKILAEHQETYKYELILQENKGLANTLTETLQRLAKGKYIAICASDDYWAPNKLEIQLDFMNQNPQYAMCYGKTYYIDAQSKLLNHKNSTYLTGGYIFEEIITLKFHLPVNYFIKKEILKEIGYFKPNIIGEDFYMNCLISKNHPIGFVNEFLSYYRVVSIEKKRDPLASLMCIKSTIDLFEKEPIYKKAINLFYYRASITLCNYKKYKRNSLIYFLKGINNYSFLDFLKFAYHFLTVYY